MTKIDVWRDPYGAGFQICKKKSISLDPGLTVLVGCNGTGKSTLLHNIKDQLDAEKIPVMMFDNLNDGGRSSMSNMAFSEDFETVSQMFCSSEGENINLNISLVASKLRPFVEKGVYVKPGKHFDWSFMFSDDRPAEKQKKEEQLAECEQRWILLDAIDSGFSVDNIIEVKEFFNLLIKDAKNFGKDLYIVASANEYELARGENCFDVYSGQYITFNDYEDYRKFIIKSRKTKDKRFEK